MYIPESTFHYLYGVIKTARDFCDEDETLYDVLGNVIDELDKIARNKNSAQSAEEIEKEKKVKEVVRKILNENKETK